MYTEIAAPEGTEVLDYLAEHGMQEFAGLMHATGLSGTEVMGQLDGLNKAGLLEQYPVRGCGETYMGLKEEVLEAREVFGYLAEHGMQEFAGVAYGTGLDLTETMDQMDVLNRAGLLERHPVQGCGEEYFSLPEDVPEAVVHYMNR